MVGFGIAAAVVAAALTVTLAILARQAEPYLRARIVQALSDRLHARVELDQFHISLSSGIQGTWGVVARGSGLRIWPRTMPAAESAANSDQPLASTPGVPLIQLEEFDFRAPIHYESGKPLVISRVHLSGLSVHVPPKSQRAPDAPKPAQQQGSGNLPKIVVEHMDCDRTLFVMETDKPGKLPLGFDIQHLKLARVTAGGPLDFEADLINPRPLGQVHTAGKFGPWQADDPGSSAIEGNYVFDRADLATFKAVSGTLHSTGHFGGTLHNIVVDGQADVPNFALDRFGSTLPLHTVFHAIVDGTNGDTQLQPVHATLGDSHFTTSGKIIRVRTLEAEQEAVQSGAQAETITGSPFKGGHDIQLDIDIQRANISNFMQLTSKDDKPLLTGIVTVRAKLHIPPGTASVKQRLFLDGTFQLEQAHFTSDKIQSKVEELSLRAQGRPGDATKVQPNDISSTMQSDFHIARAVVSLPDLTYTVPGAEIQLAGTYGLDGALQFQGTARMEATVSKMVGGWKGFLLKPTDRFFKKDGAGALIPIHVSGTRSEPHFGLDVGRLRSGGGTHPERPDGAPQPGAETSTPAPAQHAAPTHPQRPGDKPSSTEHL